MPVTLMCVILTIVVQLAGLGTAVLIYEVKQRTGQQVQPTRRKGPPELAESLTYLRRSGLPDNQRHSLAVAELVVVVVLVVGEELETEVKLWRQQVERWYWRRMASCHDLSP